MPLTLRPPRAGRRRRPDGTATGAAVTVRSASVRQRERQRERARRQRRSVIDGRRTKTPPPPRPTVCKRIVFAEFTIVIRPRRVSTRKIEISFYNVSDRVANHKQTYPYTPH